MDFEPFIKEAAPLLNLQWRRFKRGGVKRKVERRIAELGLATFEDYLLRIKKDPEEKSHLSQILTVTITRFFRDKKVLLRTKVTKFLPEIMKKNWLHLKDASVKDKDLVATTADQFKVGDIVLIEGIVKTNQDLGFGYKYDVLIEEVKVKGK